MKDELGDRMKYYEGISEPRLLPLVPVFARVDGRSFHNFTKGLNRPYDARMAEIMVKTATYLAKETNAALTYTQSDEITLCWCPSNPKSEFWFNGRFSKMTSQIAALATLKFYQLCGEFLPTYQRKNPTFDGRVWAVPNKIEAANVFLWREWDAVKNSITMASRTVYSDKQLYRKNGNEKQAMLLEKGINWNDYPSFFKRGVYIQKRKEVKSFDYEEIEKLPENHAARKNPDLKIERTLWKEIDMPIFSTILNKSEVIFNGEEPKTA